jgi:uncharacterized protein YhaN
VIAAGESRLEALEAQLRRSQEEADEQAEIGRRLAALGLSPVISLEELTELVDLARDSDAIERRVKELERARSRLVRRIDGESQALAARREARDSAPIIIEPSGLGRRWVPFLIECTPDYVEYYDARDAQSGRIPKSEMNQGSKLPRIFRFIRSVPGSLVIFLIRADGVETCQAARRLAESYRVRTAELPLPGDGPIDLSRMSDGT